MVFLVIIGALIGAGFASGQEIYLFFYRYGIKGILGLVICSGLIGIIIYRVLKIITKYNINTYKGFLEYIFNNKAKSKYLNISNIMNIIVNIFLLTSFFIMISGFGAYFRQEFNISNYIGSGILALICFMIFMKDMKGVAKVSSILTPILICCIIITSLRNIQQIKFIDIGNNIGETRVGLLNNWFIQSIIYCSYNVILAIPVLVNLKKYIKRNKDIIIISVLSGIMLFILAVSIYLLLININVNFTNIEMPAVYAIGMISVNLKRLYGIVILLSIFTTAISVGISFLDNIVEDKSSFPQYAAIMCITGGLISNIGFSNLVNLLFPVFGYLGLVQIYYILKV